jgi:hypothetical protein
MKIISRKEAKEQGLTRYFTGKPCPKGHIAEKAVSNCTCVQCREEKAKLWEKQNPEKAKKSKQKWIQQNPEKQKKARREWQQNNKALVAKYSRTRQATKKQRTPTWANQEEITMWYEVAEVLSRSGVKFHVDHVVPMQGKNVSGLHVSENMQVLPASLNISKHNQWNWETQNHEQY